MPIKILPIELANQIAAGEVVERPASVVKELVENSLDAGADKIDIHIEKGGHKRIRIQDNGCGIAKDELRLALSRHATSKIQCLDDLENIMSMGFRGEALASIGSVSRLTLQSKPAEQEQAWQAHTQGREMEVELTPVAHPKGTTLDIQDLFYNTPARRKFLRTEKTEFMHIDETLKRLALSHFGIAFRLFHNGKQIRHFPSIRSDDQKLKRVTQIASGKFSDKALWLESSYDNMTLRGWIGQLEATTTSSDVQYIFVNERITRDKVLSHAVRAAYEEQASAHTTASYILYFDLPASMVDVNVHPAKHEVRFHQARQVHDFIFSSVVDVLSGETGDLERDIGHQYQSHENGVSEQTEQYIAPLRNVSTPSSNKDSLGGHGTKTGHRPYINPSHSQSASTAYHDLLETSGPNSSGNQVIRDNEGGLLLYVDGALWYATRNKLLSYYFSNVLSNIQVSQPLLMPISVDKNRGLDSEAWLAEMAKCGFVITVSPMKVILKQVPSALRELFWPDIFPTLYNQQSTAPVSTQLAVAVNQSIAASKLDACGLWHTLGHEKFDHVSQYSIKLPLDDWLASASEH